MPAPIALFVYKRPEHTRRTIEALANNELAAESDLIIFSDGSKSEEDKILVDQVRADCRSAATFRSVRMVESATNKGLANSIVEGLTRVLKEHESIIVLEDDLVCSPFFLSYMNQALAVYEHEESVISIHGYLYPTKEVFPETFFIHGADCWGWATWRRSWELFEHDGSKLLMELKSKNLIPEFNYNNSFPFAKMLEAQIQGRNDSWAIRWYASAFLKNKLTLYPAVSLINNIGFDDTGTHSGHSKAYEAVLSSRELTVEWKQPIEDRYAREAFSKYFSSLSGGWVKKTYRMARHLLNFLIN